MLRCATHSTPRRVVCKTTFGDRAEFVKQHEPTAYGSIERVFPENDYGFIRSAIDGQEIYFHRNSVLHAKFDDLQPGMEVRFALHEGEGEQGAQASTVTVVGKHHPTPTAP